jgi:hypothetical protein
LVEILVAIGIIAALVAMVFLGFRHVGASARGNRGKASMENLRGMLTEYEHTGAPMDRLYDPYRNSSGVVLALPVPATPVSENGADRFGDATIRTQRVLHRLLSVPANKAAFDALPAEAHLMVAYQSGVTYFAGDDLIAPRTGGGIDLYTCTTATTTSAPPAAGWTLSGKHTPVVADGYGNPILFVPPPGLQGVNVGRNGNGSYTNANQQIVAPGAKPNPAPPPPEIGVRPFFASAGEDGDFAKGDDNLYSFQQ